MNEPESIVLCEGYHDRQFWAGWLTRLGCSDPSVHPAKESPVIVRDPQGRPVRGGQYAYESPSGAFIRVVPCRGKDNIRTTAESHLNERLVNPVRLLVICFDSDDDTEIDGGQPRGMQLPDLENFVRNIDPSAVTRDGAVELDDGATRVGLIRWDSNDQSGSPGLPAKQTLERLVCAALLAVYPDRAAAVDNWLESRPAPPPLGPKEYAWSQMAGWYPENGCEDFYRHLWRNEQVAEALQQRLEESGAWSIVEELAS